MKKLEGVQALRGIAIIFIVLSHFNSVYGIFNWASSFGAIGVDIFIIISGFVSYVFSKPVIVKPSIEECKNSAIKKVKKFYKLHIIMVMFMLLLFFAIQYISGFKWLEVIATIISLGANIFLIQSFIPIRKIYYGLNGVAWYLSVSLWFYFISPYLNYRISLLKNKKRINILIIIMSLFIIQIIIIRGTYNLTNENYKIVHALYYVSPFFRGIEFLIGVLLGLIYKKTNLNNKEVNSILIYFIDFISINLLMFVCKYINKFKPDIGFVIAIPAACLLVFSFAINKGVFCKFFSNRLLIGIGNISFEIFIIHFVILSYMNFISKYIILLNKTLIYIISVILIIVISIIINYKRKKVYG